MTEEPGLLHEAARNLRIKINLTQHLLNQGLLFLCHRQRGRRSKALQQLRAAGIEAEEVINAAGLVTAAGPSFHRAIRSL